MLFQNASTPSNGHMICQLIVLNEMKSCAIYRLIGIFFNHFVFYETS